MSGGCKSGRGKVWIFLAQVIAKYEYTTHHKFGCCRQSEIRDIRVLNFFQIMAI